MRQFVSLRGLTPLAAVASLFFGTGCDKAKQALEEQAGISTLSASDQEALLVQTNWHDANGANTNPKLDNFEILGGFSLTDKFKGDLGKSTKVPMPFAIPDKAQDKASNQGSIVLLKADKFDLAGKEINKFRIVAVGKYSASDKQLEISGEKINQALGEKQRVTVSNAGSQTGTYLLVRGKGDQGLVYLGGTATLAKADGSTPVPVADALIFTTESPFVTMSGPDGKYFLAMLEGSKGQVTAFKKTIASEAKGTPVSTIETIAYAGVLAGYDAAYSAKADKIGNAEAKTKATSAFDKLNTKVSDFVNGWTIVDKDLVFHQPPQEAPPAPPAAAVVVPSGGGSGSGTASSEEVTREEIPDPAYNENLGCDDPSKLIFKGEDFDTYTAATAGWRAVGDVRVTAEEHEKIFGNPAALHTAESRYIDQSTGYCLLTTGNAQFALTSSATYQPVDEMSSTMWQTLKIPSADSGFRSIQMRVAFFSQEFPLYVGTQFNDSFYIKFDEHLDNIGEGDLNRLAGDDASVATCKDQKGGNITCGEWMSVQKHNDLNGELWKVSESTTASSKLNADYNCAIGGANTAGVKCYPGIVPPKTFCANLTAEDMGSERTLRIAITDVGDQFFDSAIAIDSVVFSKDLCGDTGFSGEAKSRANGI